MFHFYIWKEIFLWIVLLCLYMSDIVKIKFIFLRNTRKRKSRNTVIFHAITDSVLEISESLHFPRNKIEYSFTEKKFKI